MNRTASYEKPVRVLIVDDEEDDFILTSAQIRDIPSRTFTIEWCSNYKKAVEVIEKAAHDIYFIDYRLGVKTGLDLLREPAVRRQNAAPLVLLTGLGSEEIDLEAMRLGAADYLIKSELTQEKLDRCIRYSLERAEILKASRASERKYRNIFERTHDVIFLADPVLVVQNINSAVLALLGQDRQAFLGKSLFDQMVEDGDKERIAQALKLNGQFNDLQVAFRTTTNQNRIVQMSATLQMDADKRPYVQGMLHDITLFKKTELIRQQAESLEAKAEVIRSLAHEIRNPLNNISVSVDMLKPGTTHEAAKLLNIVHRGVKRIDTLISKLMDSAQYFKMNFAVLPLQSVIDKALDEALDRIALKKIRMELVYPPVAALALVDVDKIKVALLNIILNAIEAMEADKGVLHIEIQTVDNSHEVTIQDNGCGMSEEVLNRLFEPYFSSKTYGVGIGLASTVGIIKSHKGTIAVKSTVGAGTVFTISLPAL